MDGTENILYMNSVEQMLGYNLLIAHKSGFVKQVSASIYDITRKSMTASKADDCVSFVKMCCPGEFIIAQTQNGYFIKVPIEDIPEKGKTAAGVKIINLQEGDTITHYWMGTSSDCIHIEGKEYPVSRFKTLKRGTRGVKCRL